MKYPIVDLSDEPPWPRGRPRKYETFTELEIGEGFFIPWGDLRYSVDPSHAIRASAWNYGRMLGRRFSCRVVHNGVWVRRVA